MFLEHITASSHEEIEHSKPGCSFSFYSQWNSHKSKQGSILEQEAKETVLNGLHLETPLLLPSGGVASLEPSARFIGYPSRV